MEYYVSTTGNDANSGTLASPWRHIQYGMDKLNPGDTLYVRGGTYQEGIITMKRCGTASAGITIKNYPNEIPIIDGTGITDYGWGGGLVQIGENAFSDWSPLPPRGFWGVEYVTFDGFTVQNTNIGGRGVGIETNFCRYVVIQNCTTINTGAPGIANYNGHEAGSGGPGVGWDPTPKANHIWILNNHVYNANSGSPKVGEALSTGNCEDVYVIGNYVDSNYEGISAGYGANRITIAYNEVVNAAPGVYLDAGGQNLQDFWIYGNYLHGKNGIALGTECPDYYTTGGSLKNVYIYNNIIASTTYHGIGNISGGASSIKQNIQIINNTIDVPGYAFACWVPATHAWQDVIIRNNIMKAGAAAIRISGGEQPASELTIDHNFWVTTSELYGTDYKGPNADPKWVNPSGGDYHLQSTSTAIGAGSIVGAPSVDYGGVLRGTDIDIGAFEYGAAVLCYVSHPNPTLTQVMGIIDYYLGFIDSGNEKTGCDF